MLLESLADKDLQARHGNTALLFSARDDHVEVARLLLEAAADMERRGDRGNTALITAAEGDFFQLTELLLAAGANKNAPKLFSSTLCLVLFCFIVFVFHCAYYLVFSFWGSGFPFSFWGSGFPYVTFNPKP